MFENYTQEYLLGKMVEKAQDMGVNCIEGSLVYNASCLMAVMLEDAFDKAEEMYINAFADTCDREHLIRFARSKGLEPKQAITAIVKAKCNMNLEVGTLLTDGEINFTVTDSTADERGETYTVTLQGVNGGEMYDKKNTTFDTVEYIDGFESCTFTELVRQAEPEEETETFRERFFDNYGIPGQFGNETYYKQTVKSVGGVGAVKVAVDKTPENESKRIINIYALSNEYKPVDAGTKEKVENILKIYQPIDHDVQVKDAQKTKVKLNLSYELAHGITLPDVQEKIKAKVNEYLTEVNSAYETDDERNIFGGQIESKILEIDGINDIVIKELTVGGQKVQATDGGRLKVSTSGETKTNIAELESIGYAS